MSEAIAAAIEVGSGPAARRIAVLQRAGTTPALFWLGGFMSDMKGTKAEALDAYAAAHGRAFTRFDYSGHGSSGGRFEDGTISRWLEEAEAVLTGAGAGPHILVGSSMGGWIALLLAARRRARGESGIAGMVLLAPATDMTEALMWAKMSASQRKTLMRDGAIVVPSDYSDAGYTITRALIEDGRQHLFGDKLIETGCPIHIIQGQRDADVPWEHATSLVSHLASDDVVLTLIKDGDHRLSRPEDLERIIAAIEGIAEHD